MRNYIKLFITILFVGSLNSNLFAQKQCSCENTLNILQTKVEQNYAGYKDKVNTKSEKSYQNVKKQLMLKAKITKDNIECQKILNSYIDYFKDNHLWIQDKYLSNKFQVESRNIAQSDLDNYFTDSTLKIANIEGVWKSENYELAIIKEKDTKAKKYIGVVVGSKNENWKKGMVKMYLEDVNEYYYKTEWITGDYEVEHTKAYLATDNLFIFGIGEFKKANQQKNNLDTQKMYSDIFPDETIKISFPNDSTAILFLGSFQNQYEPIVDSLMAAHKKDLELRPNWIIDISNNSGGGIGTYKSILPYLYTNPIKRSGSYYLLSEDNMNGYKSIVNNNKTLPPNVATFFNTLIAEGKKKPNSFYFEKGNTFTTDSIKMNPKKVAVLISNKTASSAEIFIMDAKQSKKVTFFGNTTAGIVDYGDGINHYIGCDSIIVNIPVRKSAYLNKVKYDNIGLKPDIYISPYKNWYSVVQDYWQRKNKY